MHNRWYRTSNPGGVEQINLRPMEESKGRGEG